MPEVEQRTEQLPNVPSENPAGPTRTLAQRGRFIRVAFLLVGGVKFEVHHVGYCTVSGVAAARVSASANVCSGVRQSSVFRGRVLSRSAMASNWRCE
jgi:hypothetical protein